MDAYILIKAAAIVGVLYLVVIFLVNVFASEVILNDFFKKLLGKQYHASIGIVWSLNPFAGYNAAKRLATSDAFIKTDHLRHKVNAVTCIIPTAGGELGTVLHLNNWDLLDKISGKVHIAFYAHNSPRQGNSRFLHQQGGKLESNDLLVIDFTAVRI